MNTSTRNIENDLSQLAEHARTLLAATTDTAEDQVKEARNRLLAALDSGKSFTTRFCDGAAERTKACNLALHESPYVAVGLAIGIGAMLGYLAVRGCNNCRR